MGGPNRHSPELRERAVRLVLEHEHEYESQWAGIRAVAEKIGCSPETLRNWVQQAERDAGRRPGLSTQGAGNPFIFWSFMFIRHVLDRSAPQPLIVFPHGGVRSRFTSSYVHILREVPEQG